MKKTNEVEETGVSKEKTEEEKMLWVFTDESVAKIKSLLGKDHTIDCLLLLHLNRGRWRDVKSFMTKLKLTFSYSAFKARMEELEAAGLAKNVAISSTKVYYRKTMLGEKITRLLLDFFNSI